ncbi:matrixin family metalloprotease [Bacillus sp. EB600]
MARTANIWTLAHEIGPVLGLRHVDNRDRLMYWNTSNITNLPPD